MWSPSHTASDAKHTKMMSREESDERAHFKKVIDAFKNYRGDSVDRISRTRDQIKRLPLDQQNMLERHGYLKGLSALETCVELNYVVIQDIIADAAGLFENAQMMGPPIAAANTEIEEGEGDKGNVSRIKPRPKTSVDDIEKVQSTLKQFMRDWSSEGAAERQACYDPILSELVRAFPDGNCRNETRVLVPGAGLGRLAFEIAKLGFNSEGNEFSLFMLVASNFVLNKCKAVNGYKIYPWIHQVSNNLRIDDMTRHISIPDVDPNELIEDSLFSMTAGDFLEVYADVEYAGAFDCIVTCFFIDCAHNINDFIELIHKILKPGGRWINLGPLLYHYADAPGKASIEPSYEVVHNLIKEVGFTFDYEDIGIEATYCQNSLSMLHYKYKCIFFTCIK